MQFSLHFQVTENKCLSLSPTLAVKVNHCHARWKHHLKTMLRILVTQQTWNRVTLSNYCIGQLSVKEHFLPQHNVENQVISRFSKFTWNNFYDKLPNVSEVFRDCKVVKKQLFRFRIEKKYFRWSLTDRNFFQFPHCATKLYGFPNPRHP